ncbi:DUF2288 domain-containing protein [Snodgrassella sp. CFCC 13594]|uniref:DUF2288 domain-containing protein n=1 Tax=Snodgrassella sp. CFCC 13594 TaxID=1775559 RepID=UPI00082AFE84|nr:DUF2288 domain-containing protein [Snodgrassella sp. CFCC 13594]
MTNSRPSLDVNDKLNLETARIFWHELQKPFALGACLYVAPDLDLINIAQLIADDHTATISLLIAEGKLGKVTDEQAKLFYNTNQSMWAVVVAPYVLVQPNIAIR